MDIYTYKQGYFIDKQCNLCIMDTTGTQLAVLYREVSLIQRSICAQLYLVGKAGSVLIREVAPTHSVLYREVSLYMLPHIHEDSVAYEYTL